MSCELSFVIPVFNSAQTITAVVEEIRAACDDAQYEIVLVNDGSLDESEAVCLGLNDKYPEVLTFVHLTRNFGEHNAVLAGLHQARGAYVVVLDDDGQHPAAEALRLYAGIKEKNTDVLYGHYRVKRHSFVRNVVSRINDKLANVMLKKPSEIYLSSFKIMSRFVVDEVCKYRGAFPYIDGLVFRVTQNIGQIEVEHRERLAGESTYTWKKLFLLWLNMFLNFSIRPLRLAAMAGICMSLFSVAALIAIVVDKIWIDPNVTVGIPTVLVTIALFSGVQLIILGAVGEYLGRIFLDQNGTPQFVVRYLKRNDEHE
ncbi:MAG: glycosyltransferase family 2 protein [Myxococcota bacterium]|nr:glycosyltransferase family 2 protein [Myxococcota bacterium]